MKYMSKLCEQTVRTVGQTLFHNEVMKQLDTSGSFGAIIVANHNMNVAKLEIAYSAMQNQPSCKMKRNIFLRPALIDFGVALHSGEFDDKEPTECRRIIVDYFDAVTSDIIDAHVEHSKKAIDVESRVEIKRRFTQRIGELHSVCQWLLHNLEVEGDAELKHVVFK